jgi:hypothetical protein
MAPALGCDASRGDVQAARRRPHATRSVQVNTSHHHRLPSGRGVAVARAGRLPARRVVQQRPAGQPGTSQRHDDRADRVTVDADRLAIPDGRRQTSCRNQAPFDTRITGTWCGASARTGCPGVAHPTSSAVEAAARAFRVRTIRACQGRCSRISQPATCHARPISEAALRRTSCSPAPCRSPLARLGPGILFVLRPGRRRRGSRHGVRAPARPGASRTVRAAGR